MNHSFYIFFNKFNVVGSIHFSLGTISRNLLKLNKDDIILRFYMINTNKVFNNKNNKLLALKSKVVEIPPNTNIISNSLKRLSIKLLLTYSSSFLMSLIYT